MFVEKSFNKKKTIKLTKKIFSIPDHKNIRNAMEEVILQEWREQSLMNHTNLISIVFVT